MYSIYLIYAEVTVLDWIRKRSRSTTRKTWIRIKNGEVLFSLMKRRKRRNILYEISQTRTERAMRRRFSMRFRKSHPPQSQKPFTTTHWNEPSEAHLTHGVARRELEESYGHRPIINQKIREVQWCFWMKIFHLATNSSHKRPIQS